jgi:predicted MFS family arabinose efflux permease
MANIDDSAATAQPAPAAPEALPSTLLLTIISIATGALVADLYYAQPLIASIGPELGIRPDLAGTLVSVTQIGYGLGLFLLVSLADLVENKRLVLTALCVTFVALIGAATSASAALFFVAALVIGLSSTGAQILVPFAASLVPEPQRGRTVGNVMAGLLTGILLARPLSLFISAGLGWRAVFWLSAVLMVVIGGLLWWMMPKRQPKGGVSYGQILASMAGLVRSTPVLRRRAIYQALMFGAFNVFWTAAPVMLAERFGLNQTGIALFALAGAGGALSAPIAGRLADRGLSRLSTVAAMAVLAVCFFATGWAAAAGALILLAILAIMIDGAVQVNQIIGQRIIFSLPAEVRGRVNAIYMTTSFFGGAVGSTAATASYHWGGWTATSVVGGVLGVAALIFFATEPRDKG